MTVIVLENAGDQHRPLHFSLESVMENPWDCVETAVQVLSRKLAMSHDEILWAAIRARIGDVPLESLRGRLTQVTYVGKPEDEWYLDGRLLVTFYPPEYDLDGREYRVSQNYRLHPIAYWCNAHQRACGYNGCNKALGGRTVPCDVVDLAAAGVAIDP